MDTLFPTPTLFRSPVRRGAPSVPVSARAAQARPAPRARRRADAAPTPWLRQRTRRPLRACPPRRAARPDAHTAESRSEEHTSELQSLMRTSYAVFCLKQKTDKQIKKYSKKIH